MWILSFLCESSSDLNPETPDHWEDKGSAIIAFFGWLLQLYVQGLKDHAQYSHGLGGCVLLTDTETWSCMECVEFVLRRLLSVYDPSRRVIDFGVWTPNLLTASHRVGTPGDPLSCVDFGSIRQSVIFNTIPEVSRKRGEESKS
jgi:hypothetical protein